MHATGIPYFTLASAYLSVKQWIALLVLASAEECASASSPVHSY